MTSLLLSLAGLLLSAAFAQVPPSQTELDRYQGLFAAVAEGGAVRVEALLAAGTALIAAAHLGHVEIVQTLVGAGAPLDHVNNLGWTALIEAIVLGDGGERHTAVLTALLEAGANPNLPDRTGKTPLTLAKAHGHLQMAQLLEHAGAR